MAFERAKGLAGSGARKCDKQKRTLHETFYIRKERGNQELINDITQNYFSNY